MRRYYLHILSAAYLLAYSLATVQDSGLAGYFLAPVGSFTAAAILFFVYKQAERMQYVWLSLSAGFLCYGLADFAWAICDLLLGIDPEEQWLIDGLYLATNLVLAAAMGNILSMVTRRLNKMQRLLDVLAISLSSLSFFWIVFMRSNFTSFVNSGNEILIVNMLADFYILIAAAMWLLSVRMGSITGASYLILGGAILYGSIDMWWAYLYFYDLYSKNTPIDAVYIWAMFLFAYGGWAALKQNSPQWAENFYAELNHIGPRKIGWLLLLFPFFMVGLAGWNYQNFGWLMAIFIFYQIGSSYVQNHVKSQLLRQNEQSLARAKQIDLEVNRDALTNLPNRRRFKERLEADCAQCQAHRTGLAVIFLDVDGFKEVNDSFGHNVGDLLLVEIARGLSSSIRKRDMIARIGGDEFVLLIRDADEGYELNKMVRRIRDMFLFPIDIDGCRCRVGISVGISQMPADGTDPSELMRAADQRMYQDKVAKKPVLGSAIQN